MSLTCVMFLELIQHLGLKAGVGCALMTRKVLFPEHG